MRTALLITALLTPGCVLAQSAQPPFVPFTVDAQKYQQIDEAVSQIPMSRQAHTMWINIWRGLAQQAQEEAQKNMQSRVTPPPSEPKK